MFIIPYIGEGLSCNCNVNRQHEVLNFYESLGFNIVCEDDTPIGAGYLIEDYILKQNLLQL